MAERLDKRLVLDEWLFSQLGYGETAQGMKQVQKILREEPVGWDEQNVFHFRPAWNCRCPSGGPSITTSLSRNP